MKKVILFLAKGFETVEALITVDLLRRAGVEVEMVSISKEKTVESAQNINVIADKAIDELSIDGVDGLVLPGGMPGTINLSESEKVKESVLKMNEAGKLVAAICAAPTVLGKFGVLQGKNATCYPGMEDGLTGAIHSSEKVLVDGNVVTSRGVGTAIDFALKLIEILVDEETSKRIAKSIVFAD